MLLIALQIIGCFAVTDFLSGLVHWLEDTYGNEKVPLLGKYVTLENNLHHQHPSYFTRLGWWKSSWMLYLLTTVLGLAAWGLGLFTWQLGLVLLIGANANQVHKWAHQSRRVNGPLVSRLQDWRLLQSPADHGRHHRRGRQGGYCVVTPWLNPVLDRTGFWVGIERAVERLGGPSPRDPDSGPLPDVDLSLVRGPQRSPRPPRERPHTRAS